MKDYLAEIINPIYNRLQHQLQHIESIEKTIKQLKEDSVSLISDKLSQCQALLQKEKKQLALARIELKYTVRSWNQVLKNSLTLERKAPAIAVA